MNLFSYNNAMNKESCNTRTLKLTTSTMVTIALVTAITCILAPLSIPIPMSPVPITLTNLVLLISIYILGTRNATISLLLYLLLGLVGLPVFSGFSGGVGKLAGPTGGYLIGFVFMVIIAGIFVEKFPGSMISHAVGMILATIVTYAFGTLWLSIQMGITFVAALSIGVLPYIVGDTIKIVVALIVGPLLKKRLMLSRRS